ncbi:DNA polymerase type-X family protein [Abortiporus biennis]
MWEFTTDAHCARPKREGGVGVWFFKDRTSESSPRWPTVLSTSSFKASFPSLTMDDNREFFAQQHDLMNMPDESMDAYVARISNKSRNTNTWECLMNCTEDLEANHPPRLFDKGPNKIQEATREVDGKGRHNPSLYATPQPSNQRKASDTYSNVDCVRHKNASNSDNVREAANPNSPSSSVVERPREVSKKPSPPVKQPEDIESQVLNLPTSDKSKHSRRLDRFPERRSVQNEIQDRTGESSREGYLSSLSYTDSKRSSQRKAADAHSDIELREENPSLKIILSSVGESSHPRSPPPFPTAHPQVILKKSSTSAKPVNVIARNVSSLPPQESRTDSKSSNARVEGSMGRGCSEKNKETISPPVVPGRKDMPQPPKGKVGQYTASSSKATTSKTIKKSDSSVCSNLTSPSNSPLLPPPVPSTSTAVAGGSKKSAATKKTPAVRKKKVKLVRTFTNEKKRYMYAEYVDLVQSARQEGSFLRHHPVCFKGLKLFLCTADAAATTMGTRVKLEILVRHGATVLRTYDEKAVTQIITNTRTAFDVCRSCGLESIDDIPPYIPMLDWSWVVSAISNPDHPLPLYKNHATFKSRQIIQEEGKPLRARWKGKNVYMHHSTRPQTDETTGEVSEISEYTFEEIPEKPPSPKPKPQPVKKELSKPLPRSKRPRSEWSSAEDSSSEEEQPPRKKDPPFPSTYTGRQVNSVQGSIPSCGNKPASNDDPLAEFYDLAREEAKTEYVEVLFDCDIDPSTAEQDTKGKKVMKGFTCDQKGGSSERCPNQDYIIMLMELKKDYDTSTVRSEQVKAISLRRAIASLKAYGKRVETKEEAEALNGIGPATADKLMEFKNLGKLRRLEELKKTDVAKATLLFTGIYGVGPTTAHKWFNQGCRTLEDIRNKITLTKAQEIGLRFYDDINERMPRQEALDIFNLIKPIALGIDPQLFVEIMGSFRRGKSTCGDIDIMITRPTDDGKTHAGIFRLLVQILHQKGILTEDLNLPENWDDEELIYRGLCRRDENSRRRRIDFLLVPYKARGAALLYYTGDDIFNRSMRLKANKMGYSLNQKGLFSDVMRSHGKKLNQGRLVASETELEIFEILGVPWQEPDERVRNLD